MVWSFQKPNPFPKSIFDNVAYGPKFMGSVNSKDELSKAESSLKKAGLFNEVKDRLNEPGTLYLVDNNKDCV